MKILKVTPQKNKILTIISDDGRIGNFDVTLYMNYEAFEPLKEESEFQQIFNGGYFIYATKTYCS